MWIHHTCLFPHPCGSIDHFQANPHTLSFPVYKLPFSLSIVPLPLIPGGNLIPPLPPSTLFPIVASSHLPFNKLKAGQTHTPQLHRIPCQAYFPIWALHFWFGHSSLPDKFPSSSSGRIQERGCKKWWVQVLWLEVEVREEIGVVWGLTREVGEDVDFELGV